MHIPSENTDQQCEELRCRNLVYNPTTNEETSLILDEEESLADNSVFLEWCADKHLELVAVLKNDQLPNKF